MRVRADRARVRVRIRVTVRARVRVSSHTRMVMHDMMSDSVYLGAERTRE